MPKRKTVLVTGGAGFIGSNLVDELIDKGYEVKIIDNLSTGKEKYINKNAEFHKMDIRNIKTIKPLFKDVDYVFHLAAPARVQPSIENPILFHDVNVNGTFNVLLSSRDRGVKKVIYSASSSAYGNQGTMPLHEGMQANPMSPYGLQKYIGEEYCRLFSMVYGLPTVCLRYFNVYGPRQSITGGYCLVMGIFANQKLQGKPMTIAGTGRNKRDYTFVGDVVRANILASHSSVSDGRPINIGRGHSYSVNEVAKMFGGPVKKIKARLEPRETLADNTRAKDLLGWEPMMDLPKWIREYKVGLGI